MKRDIEALSKQQFDLAVIGGGVQGAATAREAALRGLSVALVEARDFASGTSSRSTKLIHGGLRYLGQYDFKLVREARVERRVMQNVAPHLATPMPFLLPIYKDDPYTPAKIRLGLSIYDLMGNLGPQDRHRSLTSEEATTLIPNLEAKGLRAAAIYHDSLTDDARLTWEYVLDAAERGALVVNYARVSALALATGNGAGRVASCEVEDLLSGRRAELSARYWVNAAGPWVDNVRALVPGFDGSKTVRLTKGTHLIIPAVTGAYALLAAIPPGDRVFLTVPWHDYALLGTTDTDYEGDPEGVRPDLADTEYLLASINRVLRQPLTLKDVRGSWAGLRALTVEPHKPGSSPSANTREYRFHEDPWAANFVSICGGKLTTSRALGEKLVKHILAASKLGAPRAVSSRDVPLPGGQTGAFDAYLDYASREATRLYGVPRPIAERIVRTYGSRWKQVLEPIREQTALGELLPGSSSLLAAEVEFAIEHEMAMTVEDFLLRRSGLSWTACMFPDAAPAVAAIFAERFGWDLERKQHAVDEFLASVAAP